MKQFFKKNSDTRRSSQYALIAIALIAITACGHKADDSALTKKRQVSVQRTDQFQAAAKNNKLAVIVGGRVVVVVNLQGSERTRTVLAGTPALIDITSCTDGSFVALDFYRKVWTADSNAKVWTAHAITGDWRPLALTCDTQNRIWVVGSGTTIASSATHGATWQQHDFKEDAMFNTVQFVDANNGFITGEFGSVYRTVDAGATWIAAPKIPNDFYAYAAVFTSKTEGYIAGLAGAMLSTKDAGQSWDRLENPSSLPQFGLANLNSTIVSVGINGSLQKLVKNQWQTINYDAQPSAYLRAVLPIDTDYVLIAGAGTWKIIQVTEHAKSGINATN